MPAIQITGFTGLNNKLPMHRLKAPTPDSPTADLYAATNCDIDNSGRVELRPGYAQIVAASGYHSGFSALGCFLCVKGGTLFRFRPDSLAFEPLLSVNSDNRMRYWSAAGRVFFTNETVTGEVKDGVATLFPLTSTPFKTRLPAGQCIAHFKARLYVAQGKTLWISDVKPLYRTDLRHGFKQFPERITTIAPTTDGLYVGTEKRVYYLGGVNPLKMTLTPVTTSPAKDVPVQYIEAEKIRGLNIEGTYPLIMTDDGLAIGLPQGQLLDLTGDRHLPPAGTSGAAILRENSYGQLHYVTAYR